MTHEPKHPLPKWNLNYIGHEPKLPPSKWDLHFMDVAKLVATLSKDPSTAVGACIAGLDRTILATGYNGFPRRCDDDPAIYQDRVRKHLRVVHAEANCVASASLSGTRLSGGTAYVTAPCCAQCAALLIQAGVLAVVMPDGAKLRPDWAASAAEALAMFAEAQVNVRTV